MIADMKILIIDDRASELERAAGVAKSKGIEFQLYNPTLDTWVARQASDSWPEMLEHVDAIVTDLFWKPEFVPGQEVPSGLLVVLQALYRKKLVAICTDASKIDSRRGHHGEKIGFIYEGYLQNAWDVNKDIFPFFWNEEKDWEKFIHQLHLAFNSL